MIKNILENFIAIVRFVNASHSYLMEFTNGQATPGQGEMMMRLTMMLHKILFYIIKAWYNKIYMFNIVYILYMTIVNENEYVIGYTTWYILYTSQICICIYIVSRTQL